jgi:hypothetical protein
VSLDNASAAASPTTTNTTTTTTVNTTRGRLDSALSLEGFDLELPTLDTYQEEYGMVTFATITNAFLIARKLVSLIFLVALLL